MLERVPCMYHRSDKIGTIARVIMQFKLRAPQRLPHWRPQQLQQQERSWTSRPDAGARTQQAMG